MKGFYRDSGTSYPFTFVSPKKGGSDADTNKHFGAVRIQFAKVTKWLKRQEQSCPESASKKKRRIAGGDDSKGVHVAAYPASSHTEDDVDKVEMDAVLSPQVLFESRLFYNDFAGYRKQATVGSAL